MAQDPDLLRAKDRMDAASHEEWPVRRLARVSGVEKLGFKLHSDMKNGDSAG